MTGNVQAVQIKSDLLILISPCRLVAASLLSKLGTMLSSPVSQEEGKVARQETLFHWVPIA
jgi:hypothetical protein